MIIYLKVDISLFLDTLLCWYVDILDFGCVKIDMFVSSL